MKWTSGEISVSLPRVLSMCKIIVKLFENPNISVIGFSCAGFKSESRSILLHL